MAAEECRLKGKGHIKQKGKGHTKGKGKGHGGECIAVPDVFIETEGDPFEGSEDFECDAICQASILVETQPDNGDDLCRRDGYVLVDFVPDEFFGVAIAEEGYGGYGGYGGYLENIERCTATGGLRYNCEPADWEDIPDSE